MSKVRATIIGGAVGDAVGLPYEYRSSKSVGSLMPFEGITYQDVDRTVFGFREVYKAGDVSDDTEHALCILDAYLADPNATLPVLANTFGRNLLDWKARDPRGMGLHTRTVLETPGYAEDVLAVSERVWAARSPDLIPANGGVMRTAVVGALRPHDLDWTAEAAATFCRATHYGDACVASAVAVSVAVASLISGLDEATAIGHAVVFGCRHDPAVKDWIGISLEELKLDEGLPAVPGVPVQVGHTYKTMGAGFWALLECKRSRMSKGTHMFAEVLRRVILAGGDTDTNGAVAGAMLGAHLGIRCVPFHLVDKLTLKSELNHRASQLLSTQFP